MLQRHTSCAWLYTRWDICKLAPTVPLSCSYHSTYRFDVSKLEPVVAKVRELHCSLNSTVLSLEAAGFPPGCLQCSASCCGWNHLLAVYCPSAFLYCRFSLWQPHSPDNRALARECKDVKIDRAYIGSCTGGKTEDFMAAARLFYAAVRHGLSVWSPWVRGSLSQCALAHHRAA